VQLGHGRAAWTLIFSLVVNMDKQHLLAHSDVHVHVCCISNHTVCASPCCMSLSVLHGFENAALTWAAGWTWTCSIDMGMDTLHRLGYAAWTWICSTDLNFDMQHLHFNMDVQHVQVHATCLNPFYMSISMLHVHVHTAACPCCCMSMLHDHVHTAA
jgi:hypothetical protein